MRLNYSNSSWIQTGILLIFMIFLLVTSVSARKVICIDQGAADDSFLNGSEGRERQEAQTGDLIIKGGSLQACLDSLATGDSLIIVAHGIEDGSGFYWGGVQYDGFGDGPDQMPVPSSLSGKTIHIRFVGCMSSRDPDATGPKKSVKDNLKDKCGPGSTATGFPDRVQPQVCWHITGSTKVKRNAASKKLKEDSSWGKKPPHNRPGVSPTENDKAAAQELVDGVGSGMTVTLTYYKAKNVSTQPEPTNNSTTITEELCGFYTLMTEDVVSTGEVGYPSAFVFPNGIWRSDEQVTFVFPDQSPIQMRNLRLWNTMPVPANPDPFAPVPLMINYTGFAQISFDGQNWMDYEGFGMMNATAIPVEIPTESTYYELLIDNFTLDLNGPEGNLVLLNGGLLPEPGPIIVRPDEDPLEDPDWWVESFFDVFFNLDNGMGSIGSPTNSNLMYLTSATGGSGCDNPEALNFDPSSILPGGICEFIVFGCADIAAVNFNILANKDDGSCIYAGCTDLVASNFNPFATYDDGSCEFNSPCPTDLNNDYVTNTGDLVIFLTDFGVVCEEIIVE